MRILLFGATELSVLVADQLSTLGLAPVGVVYVGRSFPISYRSEGVTNSRFGDVNAWAQEHDIPSRAYGAADDASSFAVDVGADFGLVAGWYHMVPRSLRERFPFGCAGLHASLLPKFRGGAPLNWAMLARESSSGVSLFELGDGVDDGPLYGQKAFAIGERARIADLIAASQSAALALVAECLPAVADGRLAPTPQTGVPSYCLQRSPEDGWVDWRCSADDIDLLVRAVGRPYPGAFALLGSTRVFIWAAEPVPDVEIHGVAGQIARLPGHANPVVVTGRGVLAIQDATDASGRSLMTELVKAANQRFEVQRPPGGAVTPGP